MSEEHGDDAIAGALPGSMGRGERAGFFPEPGMDRIVAAMLNMAAEMWVMEERLRALEPSIGSDPQTGAGDFIARIFAPLREVR